MSTLAVMARLIDMPESVVSKTLASDLSDVKLPPRPEPGTVMNLNQAAAEFKLDVGTVWRWVRRGDMGIKVVQAPSGRGRPTLIDASTLWPLARVYHSGIAGKGKRTAVRFATGGVASAKITPLRRTA